MHNNAIYMMNDRPSSSGCSFTCVRDRTVDSQPLQPLVLPSSQCVWTWHACLTLWCPLLPHIYKASCARLDYPSFVIFDIRALWCSVLSVRARKSKITNYGLTRSSTGCFTAVSTWQQWASKG